MYVTTVRVSEELAEQVRLYCARTGATFNGAVSVALEALTGRAADVRRVQQPSLGSGANGLASGVVGNEPDTVFRPVSAEVKPDWRGGKPPRG